VSNVEIGEPNKDMTSNIALFRLSFEMPLIKNLAKISVVKGIDIEKNSSTSTKFNNVSCCANIYAAAK
jgi:hypothetical protein